MIHTYVLTVVIRVNDKADTPADMEAISEHLRNELEPQHDDYGVVSVQIAGIEVEPHSLDFDRKPHNDAT